MFCRRSGLRVWPGFAAFLLAMGLGAPAARAQFGLAVSGVGPINRSMGGASTAAPLDAAGAIYWNPATMGDLGHSEMEFGAGFVVPRTTIASHLGANALGPGIPPISVSGGNTGGNNGVFVPRRGTTPRRESSGATDR